jgi:hypothetical protein
MTRILLAYFSVALLLGCATSSVPVRVAVAPDGATLWRFWDQGRPIYFSSSEAHWVVNDSDVLIAVYTEGAPRGTSVQVAVPQGVSHE